MIGLSGEDRRDETGDIPGIMGAVRVDEDGDFSCQVRNHRADRLALSLPVIEDHADSEGACDVRRAVCGMTVDDKNLAGKRAYSFYYFPNRDRLVFCRNDDLDPACIRSIEHVSPPFRSVPFLRLVKSFTLKTIELFS
jgi:hypothetical protein